MQKRFHSSSSGFTFIEVLLVATLFSLVGVALYSTFSSAIKLWDRSQRVVMEEDVTLLFDQLGEDLRNTFYHSQIPFEGKESRLVFATTVMTVADPHSSRREEKLIDQIGRVEYYFDLTNRGVYRRQSNYAELLNEQYQEPQLIVGSIRDLKFRYYFVGENDLLEHSYVDEVIPVSIEAVVVFEDEAGKRHEMRRFFSIPTGL